MDRRIRPGFVGIGYHEEVDADEFLDAMDPASMGLPERRTRRPTRDEAALLEEHRRRRKSLTEGKLKGDLLVNALDFFRKYATTNFDFDRGEQEISLRGNDADGAEQVLVLKIVGWSGPEYEYGFDLTDLGDPNDEESINVAIKAWNAMKLPIKPIVAKDRSYVWAREGLEIVCAHNPFAKEPGQYGYCSYMGLRGTRKDVNAAVRVIKQTAQKNGGGVKDTSPGMLDFIGFPDAA